MRSVLLSIILVAGLSTPIFGQQSSSKTLDLSGGATVQRQRIDRAIETASQLSVEEAIASLSQYNESFELAGLATMTPASPGVSFVRGMLADRRICKIFEHLSKLPPSEADSLSQRIFETHFEVFTKQWRKFAAGGGQFPSVGAPHHGASAGLFFCSRYCSKETLDLKIQYWNDTVTQPEFERIESVKMFAPTRFIDRVFQLNLHVISGWKAGKSVPKLDSELQALCRKISDQPEPFLKVSQMKMFKWNAETLDTDFTHITRGVPASINDVLLELPGFPDPNAWFHLLSQDSFEQCLNCVRRWRDQ